MIPMAKRKKQPRVDIRIEKFRGQKYIVRRRDGDVVERQKAFSNYGLNEAIKRFSSEDKSIRLDTTISNLKNFDEVTTFFPKFKPRKVAFSGYVKIEVNGKTFEARSNQQVWGTLGEANKEALRNALGKASFEFGFGSDEDAIIEMQEEFGRPMILKKGIVRYRGRG